MTSWVSYLALDTITKYPDQELNWRHLSPAVPEVQSRYWPVPPLTRYVILVADSYLLLGPHVLEIVHSVSLLRRALTLFVRASPS